MNKFHVLALGVLIGLFSACSDDLYRPDASIAEGQAYFEENAVDLAPMHFPREPWIQLSRSAAEAIPELTPMWEQALSSSGEAESIVEVPVYSRSKPFCTEEIIQDGENLGKQITPGFRRLLVTTNEDGSKEMLLLTIVPDKEYSGDLEENPENFCYLGGGDFSGKVFCQLTHRFCLQLHLPFFLREIISATYEHVTAAGDRHVRFHDGELLFGAAERSPVP